MATLSFFMNLPRFNMEDEDFEEQLKQEELQKQKEIGDKERGTYTDKDGTEYEWVEEKKAWFPKITEDFIAQYQMSYGSQTADSQNSEGQENQDYYNYYQQYYQNYSSEQGKHVNSESESSKTESESTNKENESTKNTQDTGEDEADKSDNDKNKPAEGWPDLEGLDVNSEEYYKRYHEYYSYYYGEDYANYYNYYNQEEVQGEVQSEGKDQEEGQKGKKRKKKGEKPAPPPKREEGWFEVEEDKNTNVYVTGLPADITEDEFKELMNKCGLIMYDPHTNKPKLKLYLDEHGNPKGDGRCCYIKVESVDLALKFLDGSELRSSKIHVERAQFTMKGGRFDPSKKKKKLTNKQKKKMLEKQQKLFDWRPEKKLEPSTRPKSERVVVLKNMFTPKDFEEDPMLINELRDDTRSECSKLGECRNVRLFDNHPDGVIMVTMKTPCEADAVIKLLNGRWFAKKKVTAETWDGRTKYEIEESEAEREKRISKWGDFLEKGESSSENVKKEPVKDTEESIESQPARKPESAPLSGSQQNASADSTDTVTDSTETTTKITIDTEKT